MKNILKLFLGLSLAFAVVACDTENVGPIFEDASSSDVTFAQSTSSYIFGAEDPDQFVIALKRGVATEAYTPTITCDNALFTITAAEFAAGSYESTATITFDRNDLTVGATNTLNLALAGHSIAGQQLTHKVNIVRDYVWLDWGGVTVVSEFLSDPVSCSLIKVDGMNTYRLVDIYAEAGATPGCYLEFTYENGAVIPSGEKDAYGDVVYNSGLDVGYGTPVHFYLNEGDVTYADKVITATVEHYIPGLGGFGDKVMVFTLTKDLE